MYCMCVAGGTSQSLAQQDPVEKAVTLQLGTLLTALNELVQTALPSGACTDALLRELSRTYAILTTFIKYVRAMPSNTQASQNSISITLIKLETHEFRSTVVKQSTEQLTFKIQI